LKLSGDDLFEPRVIVPCLVMVLCAYAYGAIFTIMPDLGEHMGIKNKGLLFTYLTVASLLVRLIGGKASDRWGRKPVLRVSSAMIVISMMIIGFADSKLMLIGGVVMYGLAQGSTSPTLLAWATDLSIAEYKGRAIASLYMAMELGIGIGALASGFIYGNNAKNFFATFLVCSILAASAFIYLSVKQKTVKTV
jgi:MFS family permease